MNDQGGEFNQGRDRANTDNMAHLENVLHKLVENHVGEGPPLTVGMAWRILSEMYGPEEAVEEFGPDPDPGAAKVRKMFE